MKKVIQFGAGNIGRGFIGLVLEQSGYHVVFADINQKLIDKLNLDRSYTVHVMDVQNKEAGIENKKVSNISAINSNNEELIQEIQTAELITTAVGLTILPRIAPIIAKGIILRKSTGVSNLLNIIACENGIRTTTQLKAEVFKQLNKDEAIYAEQYVGFPDCSVDRIVLPMMGENFTDVVVESFYEWNVEKDSFKGIVPDIQGMNLADNLIAYIERKLFTLNTGHAITAYLGFLKGYQTIDESIGDEEIYTIVKLAMRESGLGLIEKYGFNKENHFQYIDKIINRFKNPMLKDDLTRVCREPLRKLSPDDRLIKPLLNNRKYGFSVENLVLGIGAALHYENEDDKQSTQLQLMIREKGVKSVLADILKIDLKDELLEDIQRAYNSIKIQF